MHNNDVYGVEFKSEYVHVHQTSVHRDAFLMSRKETGHAYAERRPCCCKVSWWVAQSYAKGSHAIDDRDSIRRDFHRLHWSIVEWGAAFRQNRQSIAKGNGTTAD